MSKTPAIEFPYSEGKAPVIKSEFAKTLLFNIPTGPPVLPATAKCVGLGIFTPSKRYKMPKGEFPLITISFLESSVPLTPAKFVAILAGSPLLPAYLLVSSTVKVWALTVAISLMVSPFLVPETTTSVMMPEFSISMFSNTSLDAFMSMFGNITFLYPTNEAAIFILPTGIFAMLK